MTSYRPSRAILELGEGFYDEVKPASFPKHVLRFRNQRWAEAVGLGHLDDDAWRAHMGELRPLPDNLEKPLALRYHGHQFSVYNPALGDGRGFLHAQLFDADARLLDLGTKGSGTTPWSRGGDGRLTLKGGVREVLATEMLEALGVYTSKTFSLFETGESLHRGDEPSPTRSSVLVRLGHSHVRFGSFQRHAFAKDDAKLDKLVAYSIAHLLPEAREVASRDGDEPTALLEAVVARSADLVASWMVAGFVHGVLNTDNMNVTGESFDYGPWRFLPSYDPAFTAAYFDHSGLYAFGRQPGAVLWNLTRLALALRSLAPEAPFQQKLDGFEPAFVKAVERRLLARLGLRSRGHDEDIELVDAVFAFLDDSRMGYDDFFFDWYRAPLRSAKALAGPRAAHYATPAFAPLRARLEEHEPALLTQASSAPSYWDREAPVTMGIDEVETIWDAIAVRDDWSLLERKLDDVRVLGAALGPELSATCSPSGEPRP
jgi:uncharacterized protein YdiU (UPF0061 family)